MKTANDKNNENKKQTAAMIAMGVAALPIGIVYACGAVAYETLNTITFGRFGSFVEKLENTFAKIKRTKQQKKEIQEVINKEGDRLLFEKDVKDFYRTHFKNETLFHPIAGKRQDEYLRTPNKEGLQFPDNIHTLLKKAGYTDIVYYPCGSVLFEATTDRFTHNPNPLPKGIDKKEVHDLIVFKNGDYIFHDGKNNIYDNSAYLTTKKDGYKFIREIKLNGEKIRN